jgi:hypothetical protein
VRDAETGLVVVFGLVLAGAVATFALIRHPRTPRESAPPPMPSPGPEELPNPARGPLSTAPPAPTLPAVQTVAPGQATFDPSVEAWRDYIDKLGPAFANGIIPTTLMLGWIAEESAGLECAIGFPGQVDARGQPLETGLLQYMSPHDIALAGTTVAEQRSVCSSQALFPQITAAVLAAYKTAGNTAPDKRTPEQVQALQIVSAARAAEQAQVRPMSVMQKTRMIVVAFTYVQGVMNIVDTVFAQHGASWSKGTNDYWALVKSYHAGAGIPSVGMTAATAALGHMPANWQQFKQGIWASSIGHSWDHALANAEKCGSCAFPRRAGV